MVRSIRGNEGRGKRDEQEDKQISVTPSNREEATL
jgi:hypothetical protein